MTTYYEPSDQGNTRKEVSRSHNEAINMISSLFSERRYYAKDNEKWGWLFKKITMWSR